MNTYETILNYIRNGYSCFTDIKKRIVKIDGKEIVNGTCLPCTMEKKDKQNIIKELEELYRKYKYSTPSENGECSKYFIALPLKKLTDYNLIVGDMRDNARACLESYLICNMVSGTLKWEHLTTNENDWFWNGEDKDFILLKEWFL